MIETAITQQRSNVEVLEKSDGLLSLYHQVDEKLDNYSNPDMRNEITSWISLTGSYKSFPVICELNEVINRIREEEGSSLNVTNTEWLQEYTGGKIFIPLG